MKLKQPQRVNDRVKEIKKWFHETYQDAADGLPVLSSLRGNYDARVLLIAPPPSADEIKNNIPLSGDAAGILHEMFLQHRLDTQHDFLVVAAGYQCKVKPNVKNTATVKDFVVRCARAGYFDRYVCIGDIAYQFIFGEGSRGSMPTLAGNVTYVAETDHKPLMVMPSIFRFIAEDPDDWRQKKDVERALRDYDRLMPKLAAFVKG